ncbi:MAG: hypothetical protein WBW04_22705, partial [Nitrolancea sp.]
MNRLHGLSTDTFNANTCCKVAVALCLEPTSHMIDCVWDRSHNSSEVVESAGICGSTRRFEHQCQRRILPGPETKRLST